MNESIKCPVCKGKCKPERLHQFLNQTIPLWRHAKRMVREKLRQSVKLSILALCYGLCGCAYLHSTTSSTPDGTVQTKVTSYTLFDSNAELTKFRNAGQLTQSNQWAPGTTIGGLNQSATSTNLDQLIGIVVGAAVKAAVKP